MNWKGYSAAEDSFETLWFMKRQVTVQALQALIADFEQREVRGDVDAALPVPEGYEHWHQKLAANASAGDSARTPPMQPFPAAPAVSDTPFAAFDGIDAAELLAAQLADADLADMRRVTADTTEPLPSADVIISRRPDHVDSNVDPAVATQRWAEYARSTYVDPDTQLLMRKYTHERGRTGWHRCSRTRPSRITGASSAHLRTRAVRSPRSGSATVRDGATIPLSLLSRGDRPPRPFLHSLLSSAG